MAKSAAAMSGKAEGVYVSLNPVKPDLLARASNHLIDFAKHTTSDRDVIRRLWLLIDFDPVRSAGISSTEAEHEAALEPAGQCREWLRTQGWPEPIFADSGNGAHLDYRIDLPNDDQSAKLLKSCLIGLGMPFSDWTVEVDLTTYNAARIVKVYGTLAAKGDNLPERPHRLARLLEVPEVHTPVATELLDALTRRVPKIETQQGKATDGRGMHFDVARWTAERKLDVIGPKDWRRGRRWVLPVCVWNRGHRRSAYIVELESGAIAAGCHHESCRDKDWHALRDLLEPGWRTRAPKGATETLPWETPILFHRFNLPPFPTEVLPDWLREFVEAEAEATQTPTDLSAMLSLSVVAAASAKNGRVLVKKGYSEPLNLFTVTVLGPANRRTQVFEDVTTPLRDFEQAKVEQRAPEIAEAQTRFDIKQSTLKQLKEKAAKRDAKDLAATLEEVVRLTRELAQTTVPCPPRLLGDDVTPERLGTLLSEQGGRFAVFSPEGDVFDLMAGRYSKNGTPNFCVFLKGHAGDDLRVDRVGRRPEFVKKPALTLGLTVQPDVLRGLVDQPSFRGRGLLGRFLYSIPQSLLGRRKTDPDPVSDEVRTTYCENMLKLLRQVPGTDQEGKPVPHQLTMAPEAQKAFRDFERWVEPQLAELGALGSMTDWAGKLVGAVARIAGNLHLAEHIAGVAPWERPIQQQIVEGAIKVGEYLIPHARAAYAEMGSDPVVEDAKYILRWLEEKELENFTRRKLHQEMRGRFKHAQELEPPLALLIEHGFIRGRIDDKHSGPGRKPSATFDVNPLWKPASAGFEYCEDFEKGAASPDTPDQKTDDKNKKPLNGPLDTLTQNTQNTQNRPQSDDEQTATREDVSIEDGIDAPFRRVHALGR